MAATYTDNGGSVDGSNKVFTYSFPVLQTEDIQVALNGVTQAQNRYTPSLDPPKITFDNNQGVDSTVQEADGAPKNGVTVRVYRKTTVGKASGDEDPKAVFAAGSSIRAGDLNANIEQALFGIHEQQTNLILAEDINTGAITSAKILDDTIVDADVNSSAAIAGTKVSPNFGSQAVVTTGTLASGAATVTGNIAVSGTVDGRDVAADGTKLDTIESNATADQSNAEIRTAVEAATDSNVFTDADHSKLNAIEPSATADQTASEIRTLVESASDSNVFTDADHSKLNAIEPSATADQTASEIRTLVESASDSNVFTDADHTKLNDIEAQADVTDATNVDAAGAVMNTDLGTKGQIIVGGTSPTILPVGTNNHVLVADSNEASGVKWATVPAGSGLSNVVEDTTPQLGGDLDVNGNDIVSTSNANINIIPNGTGDVNLDADTIRVGDNNTDTTITTQGTGDLTLSTNSGTNSGTIEIEDGANNDIVITPNGTGDVIIDGLKYPQSDGTDGQVLKTNGSAQLSWGSDVIVWTLGINGGADAYTFTGDGFASATDDPDLYLSRGQTYKFINGNSSGTHAFNIEKSDHDETWSAYTTGMTGAGATGGNTMTWTVPMDAPSLLKYVSGTTAGMTGFIYLTDSTNTDEGFTCWSGSRVSGLQINNGHNGSHMAFFGIHPTGYQPYIQGRAGAVTTLAEATSYSFGNGNLNLKSYGTNETTPATIKFEGGGSSNTYGVTISGPATAQATSNYTITLPGVVPTSNGQVLSATTAGVCSWADQSSGTITALNNQTADRLTTIGSTTTELDGEANLTFTAVTTAGGGLVSVNQITGRGFECPAIVSDDWTIHGDNNAFFPGPMTVAANKTVTVPAGRTLTIV